VLAFQTAAHDLPPVRFPRSIEWQRAEVEIQHPRALRWRDLRVADRRVELRQGLDSLIVGEACRESHALEVDQREVLVSLRIPAALRHEEDVHRLEISVRHTGAMQAQDETQQEVGELARRE